MAIAAWRTDRKKMPDSTQIRGVGTGRIPVPFHQISPAVSFARSRSVGLGRTAAEESDTLTSECLGLDPGSRSCESKPASCAAMRCVR
jgi:hypothetical protein